MLSGYRCRMTTIAEYNAELDEVSQPIALALEAAISKGLPTAEGKVWHGHPVWFVAGNPIVGYSLKKAGVELLFWSGQSFSTEGLRPVGKFQAAGAAYVNIDDIEPLVIATWLTEAIEIQWDYANLPQRRKLEKLTDF